MSEVIIVTGANRGIGLGIAKSLASSASSKRILYCTSRAGSDLSKDLPKSKADVRFAQLDVSKTESVRTFADKVKQEHGKIAALINNAGVNIDKQGFTPQAIEETMQTNYLGTKSMCDAFIPLVQEQGRIVNVASVASHLNGYSQDVVAQFKEAAKSTNKLDQVYSKFATVASQDKAKDAGFKDSAYCVSKAFVVALTKALASEHPNIFINACCPGWVNSDMGTLVGSSPPKSLEDGATIPVRLAVGDIGNVTGEFWENDSISSTADGKVSNW